MITVFIGWVVYCFLFIRVVFHGLRIGSFFLTVLILCALFLLLVFWSVRRLFRPSAHTRQAFAPAPSPAADDSGSIVFRVAGTTFDNDDGTSRQDLLRGFRYEDPEDLIVTFEETEYAGELAFAVLINDQQVGNVPKSMIARVATAREHTATCYVSGVRIIGGGTDPEGNPLFFGCEITLEY